MYLMFSWPRLPLNIRQERIPCNKASRLRLSASFSHIKSIQRPKILISPLRHLNDSIPEWVPTADALFAVAPLCRVLTRPPCFCLCVKVLCAPPASSPSWAWACSSWEGCASPPVSFTGADTTSSWAQAFSSSPQVSVRAAFQQWSFYLCIGHREDTCWSCLYCRYDQCLFRIVFTVWLCHWWIVFPFF